MSLNDEQWRFIHYVIQQSSLGAAFQVRRNDTPVYASGVNDADKPDLHRALYRSLDSYAGQYFGQVTHDQHCRNLEDLANTRSDEFQNRNVLANDRFRIGIAQKALNLYLKFLWCLGKIPTPPHCPFDGTILGELERRRRLSQPEEWRRMNDIEVYKRWVKAAWDQAKEEGLSIAEWELKHWQLAGAAGYAEGG